MNAKYLLRWLTLLTILGNIAFNYFYQVLVKGSATIPVITYKYASLFMPAGYAFSIWGLIYLAFIIYGIAQLVPKTKYNVTYDKLALPLLLANLFSSLWIVAFTKDKIALSVALIVASLVAGIAMFVQAQKCYKSGCAPARLLIPFSLYLGWISVATIANASIFLRSIGWDGFGIAQETWTIIMIAIASILGIVLSIKTRNYIAPAVIAWGLLAIYVEQKTAYPTIALTGLVAAIVTGVFALGTLIRLTRYNKKRATT